MARCERQADIRGGSIVRLSSFYPLTPSKSLINSVECKAFNSIESSISAKLIFDFRVPLPTRVLKGRPEGKQAVQPSRKTVETTCTPSLHTNPPIPIIIGESPKESREMFFTRGAGCEPLVPHPPQRTSSFCAFALRTQGIATGKGKRGVYLYRCDGCGSQ